MPKYPVNPLTTNSGIPQLEVAVMNSWKENDVFQRSVAKNKGPNQQNYVLYDGPPFATGLPHYGHALAGALKDVGPKFQTMKGKVVERRFGWDCHGVPVEYGVQKATDKFRTTEDIEREGIAAFNEACRAVVLEYTGEWRATVERLGRFIDMDNDYKTMDPDFMESVWAVFKKIHEKGLVYEGKRVTAYSPILGTAFSDFEAGSNYRDVDDPAVTLEFPLLDEPNTSLLVWTTTPWTVPSNVAIAINPKLAYEKVTTKAGKSYILVSNAVEKNFAADDIKSRVKVDVNNIIGKRYAQMFPTISQDHETAFRIVSGDFVTADDGTGLVHIAPAFGADDYIVGQAHKLPLIDPYDVNGRIPPEGLPSIVADSVFNAINPTLAGLDFKAADKPLAKYITDKGRMFHQEVLNHSYPHCWRTDGPLMYRAVPSWYVKVTDIKEKMLVNNAKVSWYPEEVGAKRFNNWIRDAKDWSISRSRYWGCPLPIWKNTKNAQDVIVVGSIDELHQLSGVRVADLHSHHVDQIVIERDGQTYKRVPEVFDCWFESGAMPYAQAHYPFEGESNFLKTDFPADFIAEGIDQTRGWFYTLMVLSTALFDEPAFKHCVVNGIVLGSDGKKMSKSLRNYPPLEDVFNKYGADALRFHLLRSNVTRAQEVAVSEDSFQNVVKGLLIPVYNVYLFFAQTSNTAGIDVSLNGFNPAALQNPLDQWLARRTEIFQKQVTEAYEKHDYMAVCAEIQKLVDDLSKWYVRNIKTALADRNYAYRAQTLQTMLFALDTFSKCAAPVTSFMSDIIYRNLYGNDLSVHLQDWPTLTQTAALDDVYRSVETIRTVVTLGQEARANNGLALKQPLATLYLSSALRSALEPHSAIILTALNVVAIEWVEGALADMGTYKPVLNHALGKTFKTGFKEIQRAFADGNFEVAGDGNTLTIAGKILSKANGDFTMNFVPTPGLCSAALGSTWVALNSTMTPDLLRQGSLRQLQREVQQIRKELKLQASEQVSLVVTGNLAELLRGEVGDFYQRTNTVLSAPLADVAANVSKTLTLSNSYAGEVSIYRTAALADVIEAVEGLDLDDGDDVGAAPGPAGKPVAVRAPA